MDQKELNYRLIECTKGLIEFTQTMVTNSLSGKVEYLIERRETSLHLNEQELVKLKELNKLEGHLLNSDQVAELLNDSGLVPLWINTEIYRSTDSQTIVKLICSRRYRSERDLNSKVDAYPPFHPLVPLPPLQKEGEKFDVNWRYKKLKKKWYSSLLKWR